MRADHTILVVDDHPATLYATARQLRHAGYRVLEGTTGDDAFALLDKVDAVLLDVNLPDMNGVAVCRDLRKTTGKPIILVTAVYLDDMHRTSGLDAGADHYLTRPVAETELLRLFDQLLAPA